MRYCEITLAVMAALALSACASDTPTSSDHGLPWNGDLARWDQKAGLLAATSCEDALATLHEMARTEMMMKLENERRWYQSPSDYVYGEDDYDPGWSTSDAVSYESSEESSAPATGTGPVATSEGPSNEGGMVEAGGSGRSYSDTNVQIAGVDEADVLKTDGEHIFTVSGDDLVIVQAWPADAMKELARVRIAGQPGSLYAIGDKVAVLSEASREMLTPLSGSDSSVYDYGWVGGVWGSSPMTVVTLVDVSDPSKPAVIATHAFDGTLSGTRRIGDRLYLVQVGEQPLYGLDYSPDVTYSWEVDAAFEVLRKQNEARIAETTLEDWLPTHFAAGPDGVFDPGHLVTPCSEVYGSVGFSGSGVLTMITLDLSTEAPAPIGTSIAGSWSTIMMSTNALYLAATNWSWWWWFEENEGTMVETQIHELDLDELTGRATYLASGKVPGTLLNQFAMDELDGLLRVATTEPDQWGTGASQSFLTILEPQGGVLKQRGQVGGLGEGEEIKSVRFVGERGYVVTFQQTDPLYVVDLRDPDAPAVTGALKVPGFSSYIHPIDEGHLLTVGSDATDTGMVTGVSLQIFDVTDPTAPKQAFKQTFGTGEAWSEAQWDHHAFVYYASRKLLALPVEGWEQSGDGADWYGAYHSQLRLFQVDMETGFQDAGTIDHDNLMARARAQGQCDPWYGYGGLAHITRGLFIEDKVYALSGLGITAHDLDQPNARMIATISLLPDYGSSVCADGMYY